MQYFGRIGIALLVGGALVALALIASPATQVWLFEGESLLSGLTTEDTITAPSYVIQNMETGEIVQGRGEGTVRSIASITKLFTAHIANQSDRLDEETLIVWQDVVTEGTSGGLGLGEVYSLRELLFPLLLSSSNDASGAIVRIIGTDVFQTRLDGVIADADLRETVIVDPSGLHGGNRSNALDLARYLTYLYQEDRYILDITRLRSHLGPYKGWINNDPAHEFDGFIGGKHGYTPEAGRTFSGIFKRNDAMYVIVLLGSTNLQHDIEVAVTQIP